MANIQEIEQRMNIEKNKIGLVGGRVRIKEYDEAQNDVSAHITPQDWNVEVNVRKGFSPIQDRRQKAYARKKQIQDGLEVMLSGIVVHEFGHWSLPRGSEKGCPFDTYHHDKILEAIKNALPKGKKNQASYVANAFEDILDNARGREWQGNLTGQTLFWDNEGIRCQKEGQQGYTPFYDAFVRMNMGLSGDNSDKALLKRHFTDNPEVEKGVKKVAEEWGMKTGKYGMPETLDDTDELFIKSRWPQMAASFAKNLAHLLDTKPTEKLSAFSQNGQGEDEEKQAGNGIEEKAKTRDGKEEIAFGRYASNEKLSTNLTNYEQLDALYRRLAKPLAVRVEAMSKQHGLNIAPLTYRPFDEERDSPNRAKLSKLYVTDNGLAFAHPNQPLVIASKSKVQRRSFPDFKMVVLDNSGSMAEGIDRRGAGKTNSIPWGDNSKYHFALLGFYGIENFLQQQGIAQHIQHGLSMFSSSTRFKEAGYVEINEVRKLALAPEFGGTTIDAKTLADALRGRESFVLSLSDGEVGNWDSEKRTFMKLAKKNHYAHVQIGEQSQFSQDLEKKGVPVFYVSNGNDLSKLMVDVTRKTYDQYVRQK
jgi:hypothetical protein